MHHDSSEALVRSLRRQVAAQRFLIFLLLMALLVGIQAQLGATAPAIAASGGPAWHLAGTRSTHVAPQRLASTLPTGPAHLTAAQVAQQRALSVRDMNLPNPVAQAHLAHTTTANSVPGHPIPPPRDSSAPPPSYDGDGEGALSITNLPPSAFCAQCTVSNVMDPSVAGNGKYLLMTGNSFATDSTFGGVGNAWSALNPYSVSANFCCEQQVIYEPARNLFLWLLRTSDPGGGSPTGSGNALVLSVLAGDLHAVNCTYTLTSDQFGMAADQTLAHPDIQYGSDYTYITWDTYNPAANAWENTALVRYPSDQLEECATLSGNFISRTDVFNFALVSGSTEAMNFASQNCVTGCTTGSQMEFYNWPEGASNYGALTLNVNPYNYLTAGAYSCASKDGVVTNWCANADSSHASAYVSRAGFRSFGGQVIGFAWNAAPDSGHPFPYVVRNYFVLPTMTYKGSDAIYATWGSVLYPSLADTPFRGYVFGTVAVGGGTVSGPFGNDTYPSTLSFVEDKQYPTSPWYGGMMCKSTANSPTADWGEFDTMRDWTDDLHALSAAWCMDAGSGQVQPGFLILGTQRDDQAYLNWIAR